MKKISWEFDVINNSQWKYKMITRMGVCKLMRVSFTTLDSIENGKNKHPSTHMDILRHTHNESCHK